jgi:hypothetical protein
MDFSEMTMVINRSRIKYIEAIQYKRDQEALEAAQAMRDASAALYEETLQIIQGRRND